MRESRDPLPSAMLLQNLLAAAWRLDCQFCGQDRDVVLLNRKGYAKRHSAT